jgi:hypothetical protein
MGPEGFYSPLGQVYGPPGSVLGFAEDEPAAFPYALQLAVHPQRPRFEVYVRPLQAQGFAHPQPAGERQDVEGFVLLPAGGIKEYTRLIHT